MRFRANPRLRQELERSLPVRASVAAAANVAARHAALIARQARAPWMPRSGADSTITVNVAGDEVRLVNTDHAAHLQEWGGRNNPPHAPLRRGVRAAGLRLDEK